MGKVEAMKEEEEKLIIPLQIDPSEQCIKARYGAGQSECSRASGFERPDLDSCCKRL